MRKTSGVLAFLLLAAGCGGGGTSPAPKAPGASTPVSAAHVDTPQFTLVIPQRTKSTNRSPQYVSSATASVWIRLLSDSAGIDPLSLSGNPAVTNISPTCSTSGCTVTVNGPPSPPGSDSYVIVTYDGANASGNALNSIEADNVGIVDGQANQIPVTLGAIPAAITVVPATGGILSSVGRQPQANPGGFVAGTHGQAINVTISAQDAHGDTIPTGKSIFYTDLGGGRLSITLSDPDDLPNGSCVIPSGTSACNTGDSTSVQFSGPDDVRVFAYDGLAENPVTLTASVGLITTTVKFTPHLFAPAFNGAAATPAGVAKTSSPEIDLFATSGPGSTGTEYFTEKGFTEAPYGHALSIVANGACSSGAGLATDMSQIATISVGADDPTNGTPITATAVTSPTVGSCTTTIGDLLTANPTDGTPATLTVTWTNAGFSQSRFRR